MAVPKVLQFRVSQSNAPVHAENSPQGVICVSRGREPAVSNLKQKREPLQRRHLTIVPPLKRLFLSFPGMSAGLRPRLKANSALRARRYLVPPKGDTSPLRDGALVGAGA